MPLGLSRIRLDRRAYAGQAVQMGKRTNRHIESEVVPVVVPVRVTAKASTNRIHRASFEDGTDGFRVWTTAAPERGKANQAVLGLLAQEMGVPKSSLSIVRGTTTRNKLVRVREKLPGNRVTGSQ